MKKILVFALTMFMVLGSFALSAEAACNITVFVNPGNSIPGATVSFTAGGQTKTATSDYMGIAKFSGIPAGTYTFKASKPGNTDGTVSATIKDGDNTLSIMMNVVKGNVSLTVTDKNTGQRVSGVQVSCKDQYVNTDSNGVAVLSLPAGAQTLATLKSGYVDNTVAVTVNANTTVSSSLAIAPLSTSSGGTSDLTIFVNPGDPVQGANVSFVVNGQTKQGTTDAQGKFKFTSVPTGTYSVKATKAAFYDGTASVSVYNGQASNGTITLKPQVGNINITVKDRFSNAAVSGVQVTINIPGKSHYINTNSSGVAAFKDIQIGGYGFATIKSGYTSRTETFAVKLGTTENQTILIVKPFTVSLVFAKLPSATEYKFKSAHFEGSGSPKTLANLNSPQNVTLTEVGTYKLSAVWSQVKGILEKSSLSDPVTIMKPGNYTVNVNNPK